MKFSELALSNEILKAVDQKGYEEASEVQILAIPEILSDRDVLVQSQTGSGKTAAFSLPIIEKISKNKEKALILCPTRELALQIQAEVNDYTKFLEMKALALYGGEKIHKQIKDIRRFNPQIIVATPGRLLDHLKRKTLRPNDFTHFVLDEADEMLNMGFLEDIEKILSYLPKNMQYAFFSATMPREIQRLAQRYLKNAELIRPKQQSLTVNKVDQSYIVLEHRDKKPALLQVLQVEQDSVALVFANTKRMVDELDQYLSRNGLSVLSLHGDMDQDRRTAIMRDFKKGKNQVLISTDVSARGIDVDELNLVINYDIPQELEFYVHRIGRTARAGRGGQAITFVTRKERHRIRQIEKRIKKSIPQTFLPEQKDLDKILYQQFMTYIEAERPYPKKEFNAFKEEVFSNDFKAYDLAEILLLDYFLENRLESIDKRTHKQKERKRKGQFKEYKVNIGRKDGLHPAEFLNYLHELSGINKRSVGKIKIRNSHTVFELKQGQETALFRDINNSNYKNRRVEVTAFK